MKQERKIETISKREAIKRLNEINRELEKHYSNNLRGNQLLDESLKLLRKERNTLLETTLKDIDLTSINFNSKRESNKHFNNNLITHGKGHESSFTINNNNALDYLQRIINIKEPFNPSKLNNKLFKKVEIELKDLIENSPNNYDSIKNRYLKLKNQYFHWIRNNENLISRKNLVHNTKSEYYEKKIFNSNNLIIADIEKLKVFIKKQASDSYQGEIKLKGFKIEYNKHIASIEAMMKNLEIKAKHDTKERLLEVTDLYTKYIENQDNLSKSKANKLLISSSGTIVQNSDIKYLGFKWQDIIFKDEFITFWGWERTQYPCRLSRSSFNRIKSFINIKEKLYFNATIDVINNKITNVTGLELLDDIFELLEIKISLDNYKIGDKYHFNNIILPKISNQKIINLFSLDDKKSPYLEYLCQKQEKEYKIVPVVENRTFNKNNASISEYVFLFSIKGKYGISYIIWESLEVSRATHVFECRHINYNFALQKVYDYIQSPDINNKRELLHKAQISYFTDIVIYSGSNNHDYIIDWISRINKMII